MRAYGCRDLVLVALGGVLTTAGLGAPAAMAQLPTPPLPFVGVTPCRVVDTRGNGFTGPFGPPALASGVPRDFPLSGQCGIPADAKAVSLNVTATNTLGLGFLLLAPAGSPPPVVSTLNYLAGDTVANAALAPLGPGGLTVVAGVSGADLVLDVNGYLAAGIAQRFTGGSLANVGSPSTRYGPVMGGGGSFGFPDAVESLMPTACLAQEFRVRTSRPVIAGEGVDVILVVDGVGRLGCTVLVGNAECNTGTNTAAIPADALVVMKGDFTVLSAIRASYGFVCT